MVGAVIASSPRICSATAHPTPRAIPERYALERQAKVLVELLRLLEAEPAVVVGYSMGARLALVLTLSQPAAVDRLVLESPSAGIADARARSERRSADDRLADELERDGLEAFVSRWEALPLFASQAALPADVRAALRTERLGHDAHGLAASLRGAGQGAMEPLHDRLARIRVATLVIAGLLDPTGLERARAVAGGLAEARLEVIAGAGHAPHLETPDEFLRLANDFMSVSQATH